MVYSGFIFIIIGLAIRAGRDRFASSVLSCIDEGIINKNNKHLIRPIVSFMLDGWKPIVALGIGLLITKIILL